MRTLFASRAPATGHPAIAGGVTLLAIGLMAWDHLWGNERGSDDTFPVDPATFFVTMALIVATGLVVFGVTVPRATDRPATVHRAALIHSGIAVVLALPASWLGFPVVLAGGGIALGFHALSGERRHSAGVAIGLGVLVVLFAILATTFPVSDSD